MSKHHVTTTPTGLQIGIAYVPQQKPYHSADAGLIQQALLTNTHKSSFFEVIFNIFWRFA